MTKDENIEGLLFNDEFCTHTKMKLSLKLHSIIPLPDTMWMILYRNIFTRKSFKIPKGVVRGVHRRKKDNIMDKKQDKMINNGYKNAILYKRCIIYFFVFLFFVVFVFLCLSFTFYVNVFFPLSLPIFWQFDKSNTEEAKTAYPSRAPAYTHGFLVGTVLFIFLDFFYCRIMYH